MCDVTSSLEIVILSKNCFPFDRYRIRLELHLCQAGNVLQVRRVVECLEQECISLLEIGFHNLWPIDPSGMCTTNHTSSPSSSEPYRCRTCSALVVRIANNQVGLEVRQEATNLVWHKTKRARCCLSCSSFRGMISRCFHSSQNENRARARARARARERERERAR
jgi:hypothetical protein